MLPITRILGSVATRSNAVVHDGLVYVVGNARDLSLPLYEQTKETLAGIDMALAKAGTSKNRILAATVYISDIAQKAEMNRAWDEWVDRDNPPVRACIGVVLDPGLLVEMTMIVAAIDDE
jgi:enamine deaminase RidA (YjgF/YER057c/UK114 family)